MYTLGLEFSTQSVKTLILDIESGKVEHRCSLDYDTCFPEYETRGGVLFSEDGDVRHTSPLMLIQALDHAFQRLQRDRIDLTRVRALKVDGMQHCTVYTNELFGTAVRELDPRGQLLPQLRKTLSRQTSPIWEDRSPAAEAAYLSESLRGQGGIENLTGNRAELRFPAAQILKWGREHPEELKETANIFLLSAFMTSILAGRIVPVDTGDGWGTNLNHTDIRSPGWSKAVLKTMEEYFVDCGIQANIADKIGTIDHYDTPAGRINRYFSEKYRIHPEALVLLGTGDNPATLLGCGSETVISLGSSYTVNGVCRSVTPSPSGEYNIFGYTPGTAMALSVFTNGSKLHDQFMKRYILRADTEEISAGHWEAYARAAGPFRLEEDEKLMLPYGQAESVPLRGKGIVRDGFDEKDARVNIRALCVSQVLSMRLHSNHLKDVTSICAVGGASKNPFLMQLIADVFQLETCNIHHADFAAPLGCAVSGARKVLNISYRDAARRYVQVDGASTRTPDVHASPIVSRLLDRYRRLEEIRK